MPPLLLPADERLRGETSAEFMEELAPEAEERWFATKAPGEKEEALALWTMS